MLALRAPRKLGVVRAEVLHEQAVLADVAGEGLGQAALGLFDLGAHQLLQFAVLADQALHALVEAAVLGVEIILEGVGQQALGLLAVIGELAFHLPNQAVALVLH